jgi:predicted dehydrogenase
MQDRSSAMRRRTFLAAAAPFLCRPEVLRANNRLKIGFIGLGGRARWLLQNEKFPLADIVAVADCYFPRCAQAALLVPGGEHWTAYPDYRRLLDREKLDAVFIETTTHARALIALDCMRAGCDVYAEKPITLTIREGRVLAEAVKRYKRVFQAGTQQRSIPINAWASERVREGLLGKVQVVTVCNFEAPKTWEAKPEQPTPEGLDWDQWCNQTELRPYHPDLQNRWAWYRDYDGGGQSWGVTGWGTHAIDQAACGLGIDDTGPVEVWPEGPGQEAKVIFRFASGTLLRCDGERRPDHSDLGAVFRGENGTLEIKRGTLVASAPDFLRGAPPDTPEGPGENRWHIENFLECVRTRKLTNAPVETAHRSTTLCHLVNLCRDLGRRLQWDPAAEMFRDDAEANALLSRPRRKRYELPASA